MSEIKNIKVRCLILGLLLLGIALIVFCIIPSEDELIINEIKQSYKDKNDLTQQQIDHIKLRTDNKDYLNAEKNFMLGYINLFVENNNELAYKYFEEVIKNKQIIKENFVIVYSYKFLAQKYIEEGNIEKGINYTESALYSINPQEHGEYKNLINDILRPIMELKKGRNLAIKFLEYILIENNKHPNKQAEFYAYRTLEQLYMSTCNYYQSAQMSIKAVNLAEELDKEFFKGKSLVNLARVNYKLGYNEDALKILEEVKNIKVEDPEWNDKLNNLRLLILYQINVDLEKYDEALESVKGFDDYKVNLTYEDLLDIEIMQNILMANIYIIKDNLDLAKPYLDNASSMMKVDEVPYWTDKDIYYYMIYGKMSEKNGNYDDAIECYEESRRLSLERDNLEGNEKSVSRLGIVYGKLDDEKNASKYDSELSKIRGYKNQMMHQNYIDYTIKMDKMVKVEQENKLIEKLNLFLISTIVLVTVIVYKINIYPILRMKKLKRKIENYIDNNKYLMYYQPIINPKKNEIVGFESLLRLKEKDEIIMPYIIINEIQECNMMEKVSIWILNKIIEDYKTIKSAKNMKNDFYVSMNISLKEIEYDIFIDEIINIVKASDLEKNAICIEITENIGANNMDKVEKNIARLRKAGVLVAIDDFGVEYSNLSLIDSIEFDIVKIDKIFINNIDKSDINKSIIKFCDYVLGEKGKSIVIEGVEDNNQVEFIKNTKTDKFYIQGYFYSKPIELDKIIEFKI